MFLYDWFTAVLNYFGLWQKKGKMVIIGLDNAGKTSLLHRLKHDSMKQHPPTIHPHYEGFKIGNMHLNAYDLGGHTVARRMWRDYALAINCITFVIDATDRDRFDEAKDELDRMLSEEQVAHIPILLLANKIDNPMAAGEDEIKQFFNLEHQLTGKTISNTTDTDHTEERRPLEMFMCSVLRRQGYGNGLEWLTSKIK